jgi:hypothetical protein
MGRRRTQRTDNTLRQLLLAYWRSRFGPTGRWHIPGRVSEYEQALVAGEAIVIDSSTLMCALNHARLPSDDYGYGGRHWGKQWHLDVDGALSEWTAEDQAALDAEHDAHCKGGRTCMRCDPGRYDARGRVEAKPATSSPPSPN